MMRNTKEQSSAEASTQARCKSKAVPRLVFTTGSSNAQARRDEMTKRMKSYDGCETQMLLRPLAQALALWEAGWVTTGTWT